MPGVVALAPDSARAARSPGAGMDMPSVVPVELLFTGVFGNISSRSAGQWSANRADREGQRDIRPAPTKVPPPRLALLHERKAVVRAERILVKRPHGQTSLEQRIDHIAHAVRPFIRLLRECSGWL